MKIPRSLLRGRFIKEEGKMPTYEYECQDCKIRLEKFQSIKADPLTKCPECTGTLKRLISAGAGIIFKGSGFYETDYRSDSYKKEASKEKSGGQRDNEPSQCSSCSNVKTCTTKQE